MKSSETHFQSDLLLSIGLLAAIIILALTRIALFESWLKVLRVSLAFLTYGAVLLCLARVITRSSAVRSAQLPFWIFAVAAAVAELASGWLRPQWRPFDMLTLPLFAAMLIGGLHWLALKGWRPLQERIMAGRDLSGRSAA